MDCTPKSSASAGRALTAASPDALPDELGTALASAVEYWLAGEDRSPQSWRSMLSSVLTPTLQAATRAHSQHLSKILGVVEEDRVEAIQQALRATSDLYQRLLQAEDDRDQGEGLTAAGKWGLKSLVTAAHQKLVAASIVQHAKDSLEHLSFKRGKFEAGYTGARRFRAGDPNGRHAAIDFQVDRTGEGWTLPQRQIDGRTLPSTQVLFPGDRPEDPAEWSNSTSYQEFEHRDQRGRITWHRVS